MFVFGMSLLIYEYKLDHLFKVTIYSKFNFRDKYNSSYSKTIVVRMSAFHAVGRGFV